MEEGIRLKAKTFVIGGKSFRYRELTLDESSEVGELLGGAYADGNAISLQMSNDGLKLILSKILEDSNGEVYEPGFYGVVKQSVAAKIIAGFFLRSFNLTIESSKQLAISIAELIE